MAATAGQIAKSIGIEIISRTVDSTITVGDIVYFTTAGKPKLAASTSITSGFTNGFGVALETVTSGKARVAIGNTYVYAQAGAAGDTVPMQSVSANGAGDWTAQTFTTETASSMALAIFKHVGRYIAHEDEVDDPSAATTAEIGILRLGF
jgi:hypothetical protein